MRWSPRFSAREEEGSLAVAKQDDLVLLEGLTLDPAGLSCQEAILYAQPTFTCCGLFTAPSSQENAQYVVPFILKDPKTKGIYSFMRIMVTHLFQKVLSVL